MEKTVITNEEIITESIRRTSLAHAMIHEATQQRFQWGTNDCHTMVVKLHDILHNADTAKDVVGKYTNRRTAKKYLERVNNSTDWFEENGYYRVNMLQHFDIVEMRFKNRSNNIRKEKVPINTVAISLDNWLRFYDFKGRYFANVPWGNEEFMDNLEFARIWRKDMII